MEFTITEKDLGTKKKLKSPAGVSAARILHQLSSAKKQQPVSTRNVL